MNGTERSVMQKIFGCHNFYITHLDRLDNIIIQTGGLEKGHFTSPDNTVELWFGNSFFAKK